MSTKLKLANKKSGNFSDWYTELILKAELIDYHDISGCYILRPNAFFIWEQLQSFLDTQFKSLGVENSYFPIFVTEEMLNREKTHVTDFAPEVAWVTKAGNSDLARPVAIRPTSETVMYPYFAKWIRSHRDLPLKLNQWCNVIRWEFKHPQPFLRSREFLWQEGHTVHTTLEDAEKEVAQILEFYARAYEELLAVPVIRGRKTEKEKFAGALFTSTIEAYIPESGRGIQAATSHCLGQNFSKMFDVVFQDANGEQCHAWQNSWGFTTRSIGVAIMVHSDDKGLVVPPRVVRTQIVLIPCGSVSKMAEGDEQRLATALDKVHNAFVSHGIRSHIDSRRDRTAGWKFAHWEQRGVPLRLEIGLKDLDSKTVVVVRRDTGEKLKIPYDESNCDSAAALATNCQELLDSIQKDLFTNAKASLDSHVKRVDEWNDVLSALNAKSLVLAPWCRENECEEAIKTKTTGAATPNSNEKPLEEQLKNASLTSAAPATELSMGAKSLCIPYEQPSDVDISNCKCVSCGKPAKVFCLFGRSY